MWGLVVERALFGSISSNSENFVKSGLVDWEVLGLPLFNSNRISVDDRDIDVRVLERYNSRCWTTYLQCISIERLSVPGPKLVKEGSITYRRILLQHSICSSLPRFALPPLLPQETCYLFYVSLAPKQRLLMHLVVSTPAGQG